MFFTADPHFGHKFVAGERGFESTEEMDEVIIENWNSKIGKHDLVYILGDLSFRGPNDTLSILYRLNGRLHLVRGNHDSSKGLRKRRWDPVWEHFQWVKDYHEIRDGSRIIVLHHYAYRVWNQHHRGAWNLHGHSHGNLWHTGRRQMDVGLDTNNLFPYSLDEVEEFMVGKPIMVVDHHKPKGEVVHSIVKPKHHEGNVDRPGWEKQEQGWFIHESGGAVMDRQEGWRAYPKCKSHCNPSLGPFATAEEAMKAVENY